MLTFYYYDKSKWDDYELCSMKPVSPIFTVESNSIIEADDLLKQGFGIDARKSPMIVVTLGPLIYGNE